MHNETINPKLFQKLYDLADKAGREAVAKTVPTSMTVQQHADPFDENSPVTREWVVPSGPCGFASIVINPGNSPFAKWLKKRELAAKYYYGGVHIWVGHLFPDARDQSVEYKCAYAEAFCKIIREFGVKAHVASKLD